MKHNRHGHNCHGVAVDVFMQMVTRHRWEEVRDVWPDDYKAPTMETLKIDESWADLRSQQNMNDHEKQWMREYKQLCARLGPYVPKIALTPNVSKMSDRPSTTHDPTIAENR
jgi:hypothetical protein